MNPAFPQARFYNGSEGQAQTTVDSGYWMVYAACLTVLTGSPPPRLTAPLNDRRPAHCLRALFKILPLPVAAESKAVQSAVLAAEDKETPLSSSLASNLASQDGRSAGSPLSAPMSAASLLTSPRVAYEKKPLPSMPVSPSPPSPFPFDSHIGWAEAKQSPAQANEASVGLELKAYTPQQIDALLKAEGLVEGPEGILPTDPSGRFVLYSYPPQALSSEMFLEDQARYFLAQGGDIKPRRVAWLVSLQGRLPLALCVQLDRPQIAAAQKLFAACSEQKQTRVERMVSDPQTAQALRRLYAEVRIQVLGADTALTPMLLQQLAAPFRQAYQPRQDRLPIACKAPADSYASLVLVADTVTQLKTGQTLPLTDITALQQAHIQMARAAVLKHLQAWQVQCPDVAKALSGSLRRLLKYHVLAQYRKTHYPLRSHRWAALLHYQQHDQAIKKAIYRLSLDEPASLIDPLPLVTLLAFLSLASDPRTLQDRLQQQANQAQAHMEAWQIQFQTEINRAYRQVGCGGRLKHRASQGLRLAYQHSYLSLGEQLLSPLGHLVKTCTPSSVMEKARGLTQKIVRWGVLLTTASSAHAAASEQYVAAHVTPEQLPAIFRGVGVAMGLTATYMTGCYSSLRLLALGTLGYSVGGWLTEPTLDDIAATATDSPYSLGPVGVARLGSLGWTAIEASAQNSYAPLLLALGGMAGSGAGRRWAKKRVPALEAKPDTIEQAQRQATLLFLLSLVGYEIGQWLTGQALQTVQGVYDREALRAQAIAHLEEMEVRGEIVYLQIQFPDLRYSPRFWFNAENPLHITAVNRTGQVIEADCELRGVPTEVELTCQTQWATMSRITG